MPKSTSIYARIRDYVLGNPEVEFSTRDVRRELKIASVNQVSTCMGRLVNRGFLETRVERMENGGKRHFFRVISKKGHSKPSVFRTESSAINPRNYYDTLTPSKAARVEAFIHDKLKESDNGTFEIRSTQVAKAMGMNINAVSAAISDMRDRGMIEKVGNDGMRHIHMANIEKFTPLKSRLSEPTFAHRTNRNKIPERVNIEPVPQLSLLAPSVARNDVEAFVEKLLGAGITIEREGLSRAILFDLIETAVGALKGL